MDNLLKKSVKLTVIVVLITALILIFAQQWKFAFGLLVGSILSIINFLLLVKILEIAILHKSGRSLPLILLVKFPLLYLIGFLILASRFFPAYSLIAGLGSILLATGVISIWPRRT